MLFPDIFVFLLTVFSVRNHVFLECHVLQTQLVSLLFKFALLWWFVTTVAVHHHLNLLNWGTSHMNPSRLKQITLQASPKLGHQWPWVRTTSLRGTVTRALLTKQDAEMDATSWWGTVDVQVRGNMSALSSVAGEGEARFYSEGRKFSKETKTIIIWVLFILHILEASLPFLSPSTTPPKDNLENI